MNRDSVESDGGPGRDLLESGLALVRSHLSKAESIKIVKPLTGGYTTARVMLCDIGPSRGGGTDGPLNGQYILKVGFSTGRPQAAAHTAFVDGLGDYGRARVPVLVRSLQESGTSVDLYGIAGFSLDLLRSAEQVDAEDREEACARAVRELLVAQLSASGQPDYEGTVASVLGEWLGSDFPNDQRGARVREVLDHVHRTGHVFRLEGELLPDPLVLLDPALGLREQRLACFRGPAHGDLHLRNILVKGSKLTRDLEYWLIDVNWDTPAPLLYDHAYLELSALLFGLGHSTSGRVLALIARLDDEGLTVPVGLDFNDLGLVRLLSRMRTEVRTELDARQKQRVDVWEQQDRLARIAAGLNYAAKPLHDITLRRAALASAAWATRLLLRERYPDVWVKLAEEDRISNVGLAVNPGAKRHTAKEALEAWKPFQQRQSGMDLFLVADSVTAKPELGALAHCGWATVIDLDPASDTDGLSSVVLPHLVERRHVSVFGETNGLVSPDNATNWLMANGWTTHDEASADSDAEWRRRGHLKRVRSLIDETKDGTAHQSAALLVLRSGRHDQEIDRVIDYIDEQYDGFAVRLDLVEGNAVDGWDINAFLSIVAESLPPGGGGPAPSLPGLEGRWLLKWSDLQRLSVDLEVLHSEVLSTGDAVQQPTDEFWRGRPPTWQELEVPIDVERDALAPLQADITQRLKDHQTAVVRLNHSPGAGGTTLARRVAWNLHRTYPTVLLHNYSEGTADRIDEIYQETGHPPLVIAESAILPEYDRDELRHSLAQRNTRAVLLWVNRTNAKAGGTTHHQLLDPLNGLERKRFLRKFRERAVTDRARRLLDGLAEGATDMVPAQKLSPFFFGLCVYEEKFEGIDSYVKNHFAELSREQRELARALALLTRYGQELGLPTGMVKRWMQPDGPVYSPLTAAELNELLGPDLRHLVVVERNALRLLHPLIAEKVLSTELLGEQFSLGKISVDFIKKTTSLLGPDNSTTAHLLNELFIKRADMSADGRTYDFSELIESMSTEAGANVFDVLTTQCPNNAHFWNHRGRFAIYKVKTDFSRAESFVLTAVEKSKGRDATHLHTLGMVRRFWIENTLERLVADGEHQTPEQMLASVEPLFDLAMEAFTDAAKYKNTDYTWSTPIQLIATVVERLWKAWDKDKSLAEFMESDAPSAVWVTEQIGRAEELLDNLRNINAEGRYYQRLDNRLTELYGDVERLVEQWQALRQHGRNSPEVDLAIARTLYAKAGRDWSQVSEEQARTITEMTEATVDSGRATDADLRLWFQSYRRLPEYSETRAMERLAWFASERNSLDANYYLYILHFLIWYRGDAQDEERIRYYLEECKRLSRQHRRQWSFEWLGISSRPHRLVHFSEMGRQRYGPTGFWSHPQELERVGGIIQEIKSPQSGRLRIRRGRLSAFFTPRNRFRQTRDIEAPVEFYLGFSYEGLRAWEPTYPGNVPDALVHAEPKKKTRLSKPIPVASSGPTPVVPEPEPDARSQEQDVAPEAPVPGPFRVDPAVLRALAGRRPGTRGGPADFQEAVLELVKEARSAGSTLTSLELGKALQSLFGMDAYNRFRRERGRGKLKPAVESLGFRTVPTPQGFDVDLP